jgi:NADH:ubiquinone oxidoreductase subunit 5 (subunit L)/multisubunit Na+/H+ antiporter MnhA subunit
MLARTGVPPFASFFSKGFIISSLWSTGDVMLVLTIYASTAVTFAYTLRFIILTFLREPSDYVKKAHLHEPPKTMLFASGILAALCFVWGFLGPLIGQFMHVNVEMGFSEVFSMNTLVFLLVLFIGGFPVYITYYKKSAAIQKIKGQLLFPLTAILEHGYYFDDFYKKIVAKSVTKLSTVVHDYIEQSIFNHLPQIAVNGVMHLAQYTYMYFEKAVFDQVPHFIATIVMHLAQYTYIYLDILVDKILYAATNRTMSSASHFRKVHSVSLPHFVAAALLGFIILLILVMTTMLR